MFTSGFFNSMNGDRKYNAEQVSAIMDGLISDGIFDSIGDHFAVTPGTGMSVNVGTGRAWLNSTWSYNDSPYAIELTVSSPSLGRIDLICIKVDHSTQVRQNSIVKIEGTPGSSPVEPTVTDDTTNGVYYHKLAAVSVAAGATSITAADITNYIGLAAGTPYVTGILETTTVDELWSQWDGEFNAWWEDIKNTLDEDVVTTILNKIDHITPKEATMQKYGFSHQNPPPSGKVYKEYSTDAILDKALTLINGKDDLPVGTVLAVPEGYNEYDPNKWMKTGNYIPDSASLNLKTVNNGSVPADNYSPASTPSGYYKACIAIGDDGYQYVLYKSTSTSVFTLTKNTIDGIYIKDIFTNQQISGYYTSSSYFIKLFKVINEGAYIIVIAQSSTSKSNISVTARVDGKTPYTTTLGMATICNTSLYYDADEKVWYLSYIANSGSSDDYIYVPAYNAPCYPRVLIVYTTESIGYTTANELTLPYAHQVGSFQTSTTLSGAWYIMDGAFYSGHYYVVFPAVINASNAGSSLGQGVFVVFKIDKNTNGAYGASLVHTTNTTSWQASGGISINYGSCGDYLAQFIRDIDTGNLYLRDRHGSNKSGKINSDGTFTTHNNICDARSPCPIIFNGQFEHSSTNIAKVIRDDDGFPSSAVYSDALYITQCRDERFGANMFSVDNGRLYVKEISRGIGSSANKIHVRAPYITRIVQFSTNASASYYKELVKINE